MEIWSIGTFLSTSIVLFITIIVLLFFYLEHKCRYWPKRGVKSPTFYEVLRDLPDSLSKKPLHEGVITAYRKYGRFFGVCGPYLQLWVAEPDLIKQILVNDFHFFRNRLKVNFGDSLLAKMVSVLHDDDWKRVRCIMSPTFSSSKMRKMAILVKECTDNATKFFQKMAEKNEEFDIKQYFGSFAVDVIATTAFATKINSLDDPENEFLANARKLTNRDISILKSVIVAIAPRISKFFNIEIIPSEPLKYYRELVMKILEEREKTNMKGYDFLQLMVDAKEGFIEKSATNLKESNEAKEEYKAEILPKHKTMTLEEVISQCVLFFIAGHDTTATTLSYVAYNLALNPDCQEKLAEEVKTAWKKHGDMDFDIVSKMEYLDAVLCESLRINSTASLIIRVAAEDYTLGDSGITIPKETSVIVPIYAMHRDPEWFPNPEKFDPDRFLPENKHLIKPFTYLPFGDGPRNCIGMRFVMMVMKLCLCYVLKDIKFVATEETLKPIEFFYGQGLIQAKRIPLKVEKR